MAERFHTELIESCESGHGPGAEALILEGELDYRSAPALRKTLFEVLERTRDRPLLVDLEDLTSIDTAGMAVLVEVLAASRDRGRELFLCSAGEAVRKVFRLAGLQEALEHCASCREEAERQLAERTQTAS